MKRNMRILITGSSQIQHIKPLYQSQGWICDEFTSCPGALRRKLRNLKKVLMADTIYAVFGTHTASFYWRVAGLLRKKRILHWIGTDVLIALGDAPGRLVRDYNHTLHLAGSELLQRELRTVGIESTVVPIVPTSIQFSPLPMPERHAVLAYIPETKEEFYGMPLLKEIARRYPDICFHITANSGSHDKCPLPNISYEGTLDAAGMRELYGKCSILFRYPQHDGLSMMVLEALGTGRIVIYKYPFPFVKTPAGGTLPDVLAVFEDALSVPPQADHRAVDYVNSAFSMEKQLLRYQNAGALRR